MTRTRRNKRRRSRQCRSSRSCAYVRALARASGSESQTLAVLAEARANGAVDSLTRLTAKLRKAEYNASEASA